jgi:hypothetical protein
MWISSFASITVSPVLPFFFTPFDTLNNRTAVGDAAQLVSTTLEIMENVLDDERERDMSTGNGERERERENEDLIEGLFEKNFIGMEMMVKSSLIDCFFDVSLEEKIEKSHLSNTTENLLRSTGSYDQSSCSLTINNDER